MSQTIKIKRGNSTNLSSVTLDAGEPAFTLDTGKLYIGNGTDKVLINPDQSTNSATADKLSNARTITLTGDVTGSVSFDGSADASITTTVLDDSHNHIISNIDNLQSTLDSKTPFSTLSATTAATSQWYRIATSAVNIGANSGLFKVDFVGTGVKGSALFRASCHDGANLGSNINQLGFTTTSSTLGLTQVRVVYNTTASANYAYVEIFNPTALAITYTVDLIDSTGWALVTPSTAGSIPSGYTSQSITLDVGIVSGTDITANGQLISKVATGTAPLSIASTTLVPNLNADMLDGQHGSYYAPLASPTFTGTPTAPTATAGTNTTQLATTAFVSTAISNVTAGAVTSAGKLTTARTITLTGDVTGSVSFDGSANVSLTTTEASTGVTAGTYPKVTVDAKGRVTAGTTLATTDIPTLTHSYISDFDTQVRTSTLNQMTAPSADLSINSHKLTNVSDPTNAQDAATKNYVDAARAGLSVKDPVRVATTTNLTATYASGVLTSSAYGALVIDGVTLAVNDRVLVKNQTTATQNGIYYVTAIGSSTAYWTLTRSSDANTSSEIAPGMCTWVNEGTTNSDGRWVLTTNSPITLDTTSLTFTKDFQASDIVAGTGITKSGNTLSLATSGATAGTYKSVTVDAYGRVTAGSNPTTLSGYGITDAVSSSDVVTTATASKILRLDSNAKLPASITGNSAAADKLTTARTITLTGDVTGSVSFDGSTNVSLAAAISVIDGGTF